MTFETHPQLEDIPDDSTLWRYVDLYRLLDLLQTSELHLTRVDQMEDRWEGSYSSVNVAERPSAYGEGWPTISPTIEQIYAYGRTHTYVNCWYNDPHESFAMWRLYGAAGKGVAIRTTLARLKRALRGTGKVHGSRVSYVDYDETYIPENNMFSPYVHKRKAFSYEQEYRLIAACWEKGDPPQFLREPVDSTELIEAVYISPDAPAWEGKIVRDLVHKYVPDIDVQQSRLGGPPIII